MTEEKLQKTVAVATGADRRELARTALSAFGDALTERLKSAKKIFVHPNLVTHGRKDACTDVEAVRGVIDHIALVKGDDILVGDAAYHGTKEAFEKFDYESLARSGNVKLIDLNDDQTIESFAYTAAMQKRSIPFSKTVAEADFNIVVVPAKMHAYTIVSLSVKTHIVGSQVVPRTPAGIYARWPWNHTGYPSIHRTLADVYLEHPAQLAVIDGTQAMEGNGPSSGKVLDLGWVVASFNPVAADALAAWLMGLEPTDIGYLYHLNQKGFGPIDPKEMEILGPDPVRSHPDSNRDADPQADRTSNGADYRPLRREIARPSSWPAILEWR